MWQLGKILANIVVVKINFTYKRSESMAYISVVQVICILKTSQRYVLDLVCLDERAFYLNLQYCAITYYIFIFPLYLKLLKE